MDVFTSFTSRCHYPSHHSTPSHTPLEFHSSPAHLVFPPLHVRRTSTRILPRLYPDNAHLRHRSGRDVHSSTSRQPPPGPPSIPRTPRRPPPSNALRRRVLPFQVCNAQSPCITVAFRHLTHLASCIIRLSFPLCTVLPCPFCNVPYVLFGTPCQWQYRPLTHVTFGP
ncbi:hypothetical protein BV22DRAFT_504791 [Leucogyrophana mollusca]|uniref:Uncharacterized protein n=1 Tax=Leucogyrophana mollusca TaxID=85980 RepID=A0ACB8BH05_9AGAM|nr:hypothetical protein BV22DRAFT_504791 [Leucogyrophana mollusca]